MNVSDDFNTEKGVLFFSLQNLTNIFTPTDPSGEERYYDQRSGHLRASVHREEAHGNAGGQHVQVNEK